MRGLASERPDLVEVLDIGRSVEGRKLLVAKVGFAADYQKPAVFVEGGIHAREWISPATVTYLIRSLVEGSEDVDRDILNTFDFFFLPVMNPDGYEYTFTNNRMWRKNRSQKNVVAQLFGRCVGVDLNRNFGFK